MRYVVVYEQTDTGYSAYVPDLPGCVAAGESRAETERLIREAIDLHIAALRADGEPVPKPGTWTRSVQVKIEERRTGRLPRPLHGPLDLRMGGSGDGYEAAPRRRAEP